MCVKKIYFSALHVSSFTLSPPHPHQHCFPAFRCSGTGRDKTVARTNVSQEVPSWQCHAFISLEKTNWNSALKLIWQDRPPWNCVWRSKLQNYIFHTGQDISGRQQLYSICVRTWVKQTFGKPAVPSTAAFLPVIIWMSSTTTFTSTVETGPFGCITMACTGSPGWDVEPKLKEIASEEPLRHADSSSPPPSAQCALWAGETKDFTGCYGWLFTGVA